MHAKSSNPWGLLISLISDLLKSFNYGFSSMLLSSELSENDYLYGISLLCPILM
jgi:hypothetical protein